MTHAKSYTCSHTEPGKGKEYDHVYNTDPWHIYLWRREQHIIDKILKKYYLNKNIHYLDFACGTGRILQKIEPYTKLSIGVDVSDTMLEIARGKVKTSKLLKANLIQETILGDQSFNLITAFRFFTNAEPDLRIAAIKALAPLLKSDGYLVFNIHHNINSIYMRILKWHANRKRVQGPTFMSINECQLLLKCADFRIVDVFGTGAFHIPKIHLPHIIYKLIDSLAGISNLSSGLTENPIIVAQRMKGCKCQ